MSSGTAWQHSTMRPRQPDQQTEPPAATRFLLVSKSECHAAPEVIGLARAQVQAVLQRRIHLQAARRHPLVRPHLRHAQNAQSTLMRAAGPACCGIHTHTRPLRVGSRRLSTFRVMTPTVATQSEPPASAARHAGCIKGAHASQLLGCTSAGPDERGYIFCPHNLGDRCWGCCYVHIRAAGGIDW